MNNISFAYVRREPHARAHTHERAHTRARALVSVRGLRFYPDPVVRSLDISGLLHINRFRDRFRGPGNRGRYIGFGLGLVLVYLQQ